MKPPFDAIINGGFAFAKYERARELVRSEILRPVRPCGNRYEMRELGLSPAWHQFSSSYESWPEMGFYELSGVMLYRSLVFSEVGVFPDSIRYREAGDEHPYGFSLPHPNNPRLGPDGLYSYPDKKILPEALRITNPVMVFHTLHEYGHYLLECLPLLWYLPYLPPGIKLAIHPRADSIPSYLLGMAEPFGLTADDFLIPGEAALCENLYLPKRPVMEGLYFRDEAREVFQTIAAYYDKQSAGSPALKKIYLSRADHPRRQLLNEEECQEIFREYGFTVIKPETLAFAEQVRLFLRADYVAGPIGSALHNLFFSLRPASLKTLFLIPRGFPSAKGFYLIEKTFGRQANCVFGRYALPDIEADPANPYLYPWRLPPDDLRIALDQWL